MVNATLLEGVKAAVSMAGVSQPTPALLVLDDVIYTLLNELTYPSAVLFL
jgi:hypothetical protein